MGLHMAWPWCLGSGVAGVLPIGSRADRRLCPFREGLRCDVLLSRKSIWVASYGPPFHVVEIGQHCSCDVGGRLNNTQKRKKEYDRKRSEHMFICKHTANSLVAIISKNFQFKSRPTRILMDFIIGTVSSFGANRR